MRLKGYKVIKLKGYKVMSDLVISIWYFLILFLFFLFLLNGSLCRRSAQLYAGCLHSAMQDICTGLCRMPAQASTI